MASSVRVGVDIGGTFTDIVVLGSDGSIYTRKVSSSVGNYAQAIVDGLSELFGETGLTGEAIEEIRHGTTVASNAILEHKGARVGLITTKGFRDVLEIRTLRMPRLYDLTWTKPPPMVERYLRKVVDERVDHKGNIERALDPADAARAVDALLAENVEAIAVCLINSFANPVHELLIKDVVQRKAPHISLSISFEVLPEIKEYERTSTTTINAYVMPIVATYLRALRAGLDAAGIPARLLLMQSNGGLTTDAAAAARPMNIVESGPAGGVVGAQAVARSKKLAKIITFDMGGTTAKAAMVENGEVTRAQEYAVGAEIMIGSRLLTGAGYTLKVPAIDLAEVGAGGGSHIWIDAGGALQIGPQSAGASPGPVCYDRGGETPTVTDANVLLGYINPRYLVGGALKLNAEKARAVFSATIATPLKMTVEDAAHGAHQIAASNMIRAIRAVSSERGRDPREFALFAFGGNGPLFAAGMAAALDIKRIVVPPCAGLFSSFGLLYADVEYHYARTFRRVLREADVSEIGHAWDALSRQAAEALATDGFVGARAQLKRSAALHYKGQTYELVVPVVDGPVDAAMVANLEEAFGAEHECTYGHRAGRDCGSWGGWADVALVLDVLLTGLAAMTGNAAKFPRWQRRGKSLRAARQMQHCALRSKARYAQEEKPMKAWSAIGLLLGAAILATIPISPQVTPRGVELSVDQAQAVTYGRYRRVTRRAYRRAGYAATTGYGATAAGYGYGGAGYGYGGPGYRVEPADPGRSCAVYPSGFRWCWTELAFGPTNALNPQPLPPAPTQAVNPQPLPPRR